MKGKIVYELDDPNRPRFTLAELKDILQERNSLKVSLVNLKIVIRKFIRSKHHLNVFSFLTPINSKLLKPFNLGIQRNKEANMGLFCLNLKNLKRLGNVSYKPLKLQNVFSSTY